MAILAIMHLTKNTQRAVIHRAQGNVAFVAAARAVFLVAPDSEDETRRVFAPVKLNIAVKPPALGFRVQSVGYTAKVVWDPDPVEMNIEELLGAVDTPTGRTERREATKFLKAVLANGPVSSKEVHAQAEAEGITRQTLFRAKKALQVEAEKTGFDGSWQWTPPKSAKLPIKGDVAHFAKTQQLSELKDGASPKSATSGTLESSGTLGEVGDALEEVPVWTAARS